LYILLCLVDFMGGDPKILTPCIIHAHEGRIYQ
jgi:hypothetical protein